MIGDKGNKKSRRTPISLPDDLLESLRKEQAPFKHKGLPTPAYGLLLSRAWNFYKAHGEVVPIDHSLNETPSTPIPGSVISSTFSPEYLVLHKKLEEILKGGFAREAITRNIETFAEYNELKHGKPSPDPEQKETDHRKRMDQILANEAEHKSLAEKPGSGGKGVPKPRTKPLRKASGRGGN